MTELGASGGIGGQSALNSSKSRGQTDDFDEEGEEDEVDDDGDEEKLSAMVEAALGEGARFELGLFDGATVAEAGEPLLAMSRQDSEFRFPVSGVARAFRRRRNTSTLLPNPLKPLARPVLRFACLFG